MRVAAEYLNEWACACVYTGPCSPVCRCLEEAALDQSQWKIITHHDSPFSQIRLTGCRPQSPHPRPFYLQVQGGSTIAYIYLPWWGDGRPIDGRMPLIHNVSEHVCVCVGVHICLGTQSAEGRSQADRCRVTPLSWIFYLFIINTQPGSQEQTLKDRSVLCQCSGISMASFQSSSLKSLN